MIYPLFENEILNKIAKEATNLEEKERRLFYSELISQVAKGAYDKLKLINKCKKCNLISSKENTCQKIIELIDIGYRDYGNKFVWKLYEILCMGNISNALGQYFTKSPIVRFTLSNFRKPPKRVLDPMAGHGAFVEEAFNKFPDAKIIGVDLDELPLSASRLVLNEKIELYNEDVFTWALDKVEEDPSFSFDAIIGNPAYVNYQNLQRVGEFKGDNRDYRKFLFNSIKKIAKIKDVEFKLNRLLSNWSGYSDLAAYTLILSWLLLEKNGKITFITSNHWLDRDYGEPIKQFLAYHGKINAIITQRSGSWFPEAQIPTNIFIFSKEEILKAAKHTYIPYVEILEKNIENVTFEVESRHNSNFWDWLDNLTESYTSSNIQVEMKTWIQSNHEKSPLLSNFRYRGIKMPDHIEKSKLSSFNFVGWAVHQGLRTGCNEVFYIKKSEINNESYIASVTREGKKIDRRFNIKSNNAIPSIQKITSNDPLKLTEKNADVYLLYLKNWILNEDLIKIKEKYPEKWIEAWKIDDSKIIQKDLTQHLIECQSVPYEGKGGKRKPANQLSAVKTNVYTPSLDTKTIPSPPSFWYHIKLKPRHYGKIIVPRVSGGALRSYLIDATQKILTDANFVTLIPKSERIPPEILWVWLNSNTFRLMAELNGVPMGGGALKIESSIIKKLPIPSDTIHEKRSELTNIATRLDQNLSEKELLDTGEKIDKTLFGFSSSIRLKLEEYIEIRNR